MKNNNDTYLKFLKLELKSELKNLIKKVEHIDGIVLGCPLDASKAHSGECRDNHVDSVAKFLNKNPQETNVIALTHHNFMSDDETNLIKKFNGLNLEHWEILREVLAEVLNGDKVSILLDHTAAMWNTNINYYYNTFGNDINITLEEKKLKLEEVTKFITENILKDDGKIYYQYSCKLSKNIKFKEGTGYEFKELPYTNQEDLNSYNADIQINTDNILASLDISDLIEISGNDSGSSNYCHIL